MPSKVLKICDNCGKEFERLATEVKYREKTQMCKHTYCSQECAGLARRSNKAQEDKRREKAEYDARRRILKREEIRLKKAEYYQRTRDPVKEREYRKANVSRHVEYCRRPEYKQYKREYDRQYRSKEYGEFSDCYLLLIDLQKETRARLDSTESLIQRDIHNKTLRRKRNA